MAFLNRQFGPFTLLKRLGVGGMAEVFLAVRQCGLGANRFAALKCILPPYNHVESYVRLFYHEARIGLGLMHANIAETWSCGVIEGRHTMEMDYMRGATVSELLAAGPIPLDVAVWIGICALDGLDYLHHACDPGGMPLGIVHRDITPDNIFIGYDGTCRIFDFGVALCGTEVDDIQQGMMIGKYAYMSPEQCRGESLDGRSDIFSMASVLYEMCMGRPSFARDGDIRTIDAVMNGDVEAPNRLNWNFPAFLSQCIMHGLSPDAAHRYQTAGDFASELRVFMKMHGTLNPCEQCRRYMEQIFGARQAEESSFLQSAMAQLEPSSPNLSDLMNAGALHVEDFCDDLSQAADIAVSKLVTLAPAAEYAGERADTVTDFEGIGTSPAGNSEHQNVAQRMKNWIFKS